DAIDAGRRAFRQRWSCRPNDVAPRKSVSKDRFESCRDLRSARLFMPPHAWKNVDPYELSSKGCRDGSSDASNSEQGQRAWSRISHLAGRRAPVARGPPGQGRLRLASARDGVESRSGRDVVVNGAADRSEDAGAAVPAEFADLRV